MKYAIIFALLAVLATQHTSAKSIEVYDERSMQDLIDKVKDAIAKLETIVEGAIESAKLKLQSLTDAIRDKANEVIANAKVIIAEEVSKMKEKIDEIEKQAGEVGVDVKDCVVENEKLLEELPKSAVNKVIECVTDEVNKAVNVIKDAINEIIDIKDEIIDMPGALVECISGEESKLTCIVRLVTRIAKDVTGIPIMIEQKISEVTKLVTHLESDLTKCGISKALELSKEVAEIGMTVASCVADKMDEKH